MAGKSKIEWTEVSWNPVTGCDKISPGCKHCYAELMAKRLKAMGQRNYANGFSLTLQPHMLELPLKWKAPTRIFVNSMSDLFHKDVPDGYIQQVFAVMRRAHWHKFQVLTKRSDRLLELARKLPWEPNIWMGVSVENQKYADERIPHLLQTPAAVRFLSCEPLLGPVDLGLLGTCPKEWGIGYRMIGDLLHWVIVGGESGPGARDCNIDWIRSIVQQCKAAHVPCFVKQLGAKPYWFLAKRLNKDAAIPPRAYLNLRGGKGGNPYAWPEDLRVREYPEVQR